MKQRILVCLTIALLLVLGLCSTAMAATIPEVSVVLSENRFSGPAEVTVTISVTNTTDAKLPGPIALYDPDGHKIEEFGTPTLEAGASKSWTGTWMVTEKQLAEGRITFILGYTMPDESGVLIPATQPFYSSIVNVGATAEVSVRRTITPTTARQGQKVYVIYEISNVGGVDVTDVTIKESSAVASASGKIAQIKAGETATHTFTVTMGKKNLSSHATISYKANGQAYTETVDEATIKYGNVKLEAALKADKKGGAAGDVLKLTLTLKNTGKVDIENISVTDPILGTVFSGLTVEANSTLTQEKELTITQTCDYLFTVSGTNASGEAVQTATERVNVIAVDPAKVVSLAVTAEADKSTIYTLPGVVKFTVYVTNTSSVDATDVTVTSSGVTLYTFDTIAAGQTVSFVRDVRVDIPGKFRFDATTPDQLGADMTFYGNEVQIIHAAPTSTPTQVPIATPAIPQLEDIPTSDGLPAYMDTAEQALKIGFWVLLGLTGVCLVLVIVGIAGRSARAAKSGQAADHLERSGSSDYTQAVSAKKRRILTDNEEDDAPAADDSEHRYMAEEPTDIPAPEASTPDEESPSIQDAMSELYPEATSQEEPAEESTYRRRRRSSAEE